MTANKGELLKRRLIRACRKNKPIPTWKRMLPETEQQYNKIRRHWRKTKLKYHE